MVLTFSLSLIVWFSIVLSRLEFSFVRFLSHFTPRGSPVYLVPVLKLIELVSNLIRPLTLALRLSINMTTGHILISLISTRGRISLFSINPMFLLIVILISGYILFEVGICFIQGFVFSLLGVQYLKEHR